MGGGGWHISEAYLTEIKVDVILRSRCVYLNQDGTGGVRKQYYDTANLISCYSRVRLLMRRARNVRFLHRLLKGCEIPMADCSTQETVLFLVSCDFIPATGCVSNDYSTSEAG